MPAGRRHGDGATPPSVGGVGHTPKWCRPYVAAPAYAKYVELIWASAWACILLRMNRVELVPEYRPNGTIVLRAVVVGPIERLRRFLRRQLAA